MVTSLRKNPDGSLETETEDSKEGREPGQGHGSGAELKKAWVVGIERRGHWPSSSFILS